MLLERKEFNRLVFNRDNGTCVFCDKPAVDAHHILDRKLFVDGGYYLNNGASVCEDHHWGCETTLITVEQVREACGITEKILPQEFDKSIIYDKWGNELIDNVMRRPGPLFKDDGVQKIFKKNGLLWTFLGL